MKTAAIALLASFVLALPASAEKTRRCSGDQSPEAATWLSIAHPGLGEWYLKDWGPFWDKAPQKKFWLGFIPGYGWPGYLQVKSAIDAHHCRVNDDLTRRK
ncbi:MAG: hypothetical protein OER21_16795 [Gemmatimonadota bacterium]|nr:hypothetical protein [Gemmatimonadota bacterium]